MPPSGKLYLQSLKIHTIHCTVFGHLLKEPLCALNYKTYINKVHHRARLPSQGLKLLYTCSTGAKHSSCWPERVAAAVLAAALLCLPGAVGCAEARVSSSEAGDTLTGIPRIIDGDTLVVPPGLRTSPAFSKTASEAIEYAHEGTE